MILSKIRWVVFGVMATFLGVGCGVKEEPGDSSDLHAVYDEEGYHFHFAPKKGDEDLLTFWSCFTKAANTRLALGSCVPSFVSSSASWVPFDPEELKSAMSPEDRAAIDVILYGDDVYRDQWLGSMVSATADAVGGIALAQVIGAVLSVGYGVWQSNITAVGFGYGMLYSALFQVAASNASIEEYNAFQARKAKVRGWEQAQEEAGLGKVQNLQVLADDYSLATSLSKEDLAHTPSVKILLHDVGQFLKRQNISSMSAATHYCYPCENGALAGVRQCDREAEGYGMIEEYSSSPHMCEAL